MRISQVKECLKRFEKVGFVPMLFGESGIGKTTVVQDFAKENGYKLVTLHLAQMADVGDLMGLPEIIQTDNGPRTKFILPEHFPSTDDKILFFFDEINRCMNKDIVQAIFNFIDKKMLGTSYFPNAIAVAAANPDTKDYDVIDMDDKAWKNRFCFLKVESSVDDLLDYSQSMHPSIRSFLAKNKEVAGMNGEWSLVDKNQPTPRMWERTISNYMNAGLPQDDVFFEILTGCLGSEVATQYRKFLVEEYEAFTVDDVFAGKLPEKLETEQVGLVLRDLKKVLDQERTARQLEKMSQFLVKINQDQFIGFFKEVKESLINGSIIVDKGLQDHLFEKCMLLNERLKSIDAKRFKD